MTPMAHTSLEESQQAKSAVKHGIYLHGLAVAALVEDLGRHVARSTACRGQDVELLLVHDTRQAKVSNHQVGIVFRRAEQQVLGLEIAMDNAVVVEVCDGRQSGTDEVCGIALVVGALATDAVEQLAAQGQIRDEIQVVHRLKVVDQCENVLVAHRHALEHGNLVAHHVLTASHQALVDDLGGIVASGVDVHALLDDRV
jgi:hypothetical protein